MDLGVHALIAQAEREIKSCKNFLDAIYSELQSISESRIIVVHKETGKHYDKMLRLFGSNIPNYVKHEIHDDLAPGSGVLGKLAALQSELSEMADKIGTVLETQVEKYQSFSEEAHRSNAAVQATSKPVAETIDRDRLRRPRI